LIALISAVGLTGCVTPIPSARRDLLDFIHVGQTARQEVILNLGQPSAAFEHETILTYRIGEDTNQGYYILTPRAMLPWQSVRYSLVLVFDGTGVLRKKNLVRVE
jgi:hypothetical protein